MEFGRRIAAERDLEKSEAFSLSNIRTILSPSFLSLNWMNWEEEEDFLFVPLKI